MKDFELKEVKITDLHCNKGQIPGVPKNPRTIKDERFRKLVKSLQDAPEMLHLREVIAYDNGGELVVICGNQRLAAAKDAGLKTLPTKILPQSTPAEKLREYTIKDNIAFGEDDWEAVASWDIDELKGWGMDFEKNNVIVEEKAGEMEVQEIRAVELCHVLISYYIDSHNKVQEAVKQLECIEGVDIVKSIT